MSKDLILIPARGGSKGVPGKNYMLIDGQPLISYSIECALELKDHFQIMVSSDDEQILNIARNYSDVLIHQRSENIAGDQSPITETIEVILHQLKREGNEPQKIVLLQPTSPLRTSHQVRECASLLEQEPQINSVISVVSMDDIHPARMYWQKNSLQMESILPEFQHTRRQDIPPALYRNGAIYAFRTAEFQRQKKVMMDPSAPYLMPFDWLLNIDSKRDVLIAKAILPAWKNGDL
ncbi:MAG: acylneuraminate cytidylyltransferase family protein [Crocinitomicaceae bacterium]|jgi:CMP-N-acetylneuraminic acid synthetase|nr:acylneuraminate cytidylyltransferase family protein [Crocinitomicaceae bacterium]